VPFGALETRRGKGARIPATNKDLDSLKDRGLFRDDLYYRLNVLRLTLLPLRERKEDIEMLTQEILTAHMERGITPPHLTAEAIAALLLYNWPGNIRELENACKRALVLAGVYGPIDVKHLPPEVAGNLQVPPPRHLFRRHIKSAKPPEVPRPQRSPRR